MHGITSNYINPNERDANCTYFDTEYFEMRNGHLYFDPSFSSKIRQIEGSFDELTFTFIEY